MPSSSTTFLKLTIVASSNGKPHHLNKWFRRSKTTTTASSSSSPASLSPTSSRTISKAGAFPPMCLRGWCITPCAPLGLPAHGTRKVIFRRLGFGGQKINSSSSQGGMGPLNNNSKDEQWNENDRLPSQNNAQGHPKQPSRPMPTRLRQQQQQQSAKLLTLPTILTIGRVAAIPVLVSTFYMNSWFGTTATTSIFIAAAITDWLDGYLARRMNLGTAFGAFLDPVADKLMVAATLVLLCTRPPEVAMFEQLPWLLTVPSIAIIGREITMSAVREWAASQGSKLSEAVAVNNLGKWKTATQMISLTILLATRDSSFTEAGVVVGTGVAMLYVSAGLAVWSLVVYMRKIWKFLMI